MKEELQRILCKKLSQELQIYKYKKLQESSEDVYDSAYEVDSIINIYVALTELIEECDCNQLQTMIATPDVLWMMYGCWLKTEDSVWEEIKRCVKLQMNAIKSDEKIIWKENDDEKTCIDNNHYEKGVA